MSSFYLSIPNEIFDAFVQALYPQEKYQYFAESHLPHQILFQSPSLPVVIYPEKVTRYVDNKQPCPKEMADEIWPRIHSALVREARHATTDSP